MTSRRNRTEKAPLPQDHDEYVRRREAREARQREIDEARGFDPTVKNRGWSRASSKRSALEIHTGVRVRANRYGTPRTKAPKT